jgi:hypothetical protein
LVRLAALINFEAFRPVLAKSLVRSDGSNGGGSRCDAAKIDLANIVYSATRMPWLEKRILPA